MLFSRADLKSFPSFLKLDSGKFRFLLSTHITSSILVLLSPRNHTLTCPPGLSNLSPAQQQAILENGAEFKDGTATISFDNLTQEAILRRLLPDAGEITSRFEQIGHIAHVNLQPHLHPHKYVIGQVLLLKNAAMGIRTVVNKTNFIENQFRVLPMEVIAGPDDTMVELDENGVKFRFDFRDVFWNSRLLNEHRRITLLANPGDVIWDMCAGVGPFAIPLARRGCSVFANDLNPACFKFLDLNADANLGHVYVSISVSLDTL